MDNPQNRSIQFSEIIPAPIGQVWQAWATEEGVRTFFAPECRIELVPGGAYEMYFNLDSPVGLKGGEGCKVLAVDEPSLLSFTWNALPELPLIRDHYTHVVVYLVSISEDETLVTLIHDGWGNSEKWDEGIQYFERAWGEIVLPRLRQRFLSGPIRWQELE